MPAHDASPYRHLSLGRAVILFAWLAAVGLLAVYLHSAPSARPATAPATAFSAERAMAHVEALAQGPRPAGTPAHAEARQYLLDQLEALGIPAEVQTALVHWRPGALTTVHNVIGRIRGTGNGDAVVLMAHYDSVTFGPGASDDAAGCAAILEAARAFLAADTPHENDFILLLTDAEEGRRLGGWGLRGAIAFVEQHPWMADVRLVLNFDSRGSRGASYMYESSEESGALIAALRASGAKTIATSLGYDVYSNMPVNSDFTIFKEAGIPGMNFAYVDGLPHYHTALDTPENLSRASLQHHGDYALPLMRHFANGPLTDLERPNAVYFNTLGRHLVHYPASWAIPLSVLAVLVFAAVMALGMVRRAVTLKGTVAVLAGVAVCAVITSITAGAVFLIGYQARDVYILYRSDAFVAALASFSTGLVGLFAAWAGRRFALADLAAGGLLAWSVVLMIIGTRFLGASYIPTWNLLLGTITLLALLGVQVSALGRGRLVVLGALAVPPLLLTAPVFYGLHTSIVLVFSFGTLLIFVLMLAAILPQLALVGAGRPWLVPGVAWAVGAVYFVYGLAWPGFSAEEPKMNCLNYMLRVDTAEAYWVSCDGEPDAWTEQFFPSVVGRNPVLEFLPNHDGAYLKSPAPLLDLEPPAVTLLSDAAAEGRRAVTLRVHSPRQAPRMMLYAEEGTRILSAAVNGTPLMPVDEPIWFLDYTGLPHEGFDLRLEVAEAAPLALLAVDNDYQLPAIIGEEFAPRPDWMMPMTNTVDFNRGFIKSDETHVARRYAF